MNNCIFCQIINCEIKHYQIFESKHNVAILDAFPVSVGHALIITKQHFENLMLTDDEILSDLVLLAKKVANLLSQKFDDIKGFNYLSNQGIDAYQSVFHTHLHIIPKYQKETGFCFNELRADQKIDLDQIHQKIMKK